MSARRIVAIFAMALLASTTWAADETAQASSQAKKQMQHNSAAAKNIKAPVVKKKTDNQQFQALDEATKMESKKFDTLSRSSKSRHGEARNAVRNER